MRAMVRLVVAAVSMLMVGQVSLIGPGTAAAATPQTWLQLVNQVRTDAGLNPVTEDTQLEAGIQKHLTYLAKTPKKYFTGEYQNMHLENPQSPYWSKSGAYEGDHSDLAFGEPTDLAAIDAWLEAPFHAIGILRPALTGVGFARDPKTGDAGLDVTTDLNGPTADQPVTYPGGSTTLTRFGGESPDPTQTCTAPRNASAPNAGGGPATGGQGETGWGTTQQAPNPGLPLIALLPSAPASGLTATLTGPDGSTVSSTGNDLCVVDSDTFYTTDSVYGPTGQEILDGDHAVLLIPREPLVKGDYTVTISQPSQPDVTWQFTSDPAPMPPNVSAGAVQCSWTRGNSGEAAVSITNVADSNGAASYAVTVSDRTVDTKAIGDGESGGVDITKLPPGTFPVAVKGSDGTSALGSVRIPACPSWLAARAAFSPFIDLRHHRVQVRLDNSRNNAETTFAVSVNGHRPTKHAVKGGKRETVNISVPLQHKVTVVVKVGSHEIARETYTISSG